MLTALPSFNLSNTVGSKPMTQQEIMNLILGRQIKSFDLQEYDYKRGLEKEKQAQMNLNGAINKSFGRS